MKKQLLSWALALSLGTTWAQHGALDTSFDPGTGFNSLGTNRLSLASDGSIYVGGLFSGYNGSTPTNIARLSSSGALDASFAASSPNTYCTPFALPNGQVVVAGGFILLSPGGLCKYVYRMNANGSLDNTLDVNRGTNGAVQDVLVQPDGKILLGGGFTQSNGASRNRITRLNADGSNDASFTPGTGANGTGVFKMLRQPDGKIIIGGNFNVYNGVSRFNLARLNADGTLDAGFDPGTGPNGDIKALALLPDGRIYIGGSFTRFNGTNINAVARLNANGSLDTRFNPTGSTASTVTALVVMPNGKVAVGGDFLSFGSSNVKALALVDSNGTVDASFNAGGAGLTGSSTTFSRIYVNDMALQSDGRLVVTGAFDTYNGVSRNRIVRLTTELTSLASAQNRPRLSLYPNPSASGKVRLLGLQAPTSVEIWNTQGQRVHQAPVEESGELEASHLPSGVYLLRTLGSQAQTLRWVKE